MHVSFGEDTESNDGQVLTDALGWWSPNPRGVLPLESVRISRSLRQSIKRFEVTVDQSFDAVIAGCSDEHRPGGWINEEIIDAYLTLAPAGLGSQRRGLGRRRTRRGVVRRGHRRVVRRGVDVPPHSGRLKSGPGPPGGTATKGRAGTLAGRPVAHPALGFDGCDRGLQTQVSGPPRTSSGHAATDLLWRASMTGPRHLRPCSPLPVPRRPRCANVCLESSLLAS